MDGTVRGLLYGSPGQLFAQLVMIVVNLAWAFGVTFLLISVAKRFMAIRVSPEVEMEGLDMAEFGAVCYPEFVVKAGPGHAQAAGSGRRRPTTAEPGELVALDTELAESLVEETTRRVLEVVRAGERAPD